MVFLLTVAVPLHWQRCILMYHFYFRKYSCLSTIILLFLPKSRIVIYEHSVHIIINLIIAKIWYNIF